MSPNLSCLPRHFLTIKKYRSHLVLQFSLGNSLIFGKEQEHLFQRRLAECVVLDFQLLLRAFHQAKHLGPFQIRYRYVEGERIFVLLPGKK